MSSFTELTGSELRTTSRKGAEAMLVFGSKSCSGSKLPFCCSTALEVKLLEARNSVYPSGGALATAAAPIDPAAPGRLSTTTGCPSSSPRAGASVRAMMSVAPPGAKPTTSRIGFVGYACAIAYCETASSRHANRLVPRNVYLTRMRHGAKRIPDFRFRHARRAVHGRARALPLRRGEI